MSRGDAAHIITSHLLLINTYGRELVERCSHCCKPWPCAFRVAAETVLFGAELPR